MGLRSKLIKLPIVHDAISTALKIPIIDNVVSAVASVPAVRDDMVRPTVQYLMSKCVISIDTITIIDPQENSFGICVEGVRITKAGPYNTMISFGDGLDISWNGRVLGKIIEMPNVDIEAGMGARFNILTTFEVTNVAALAGFIKVLFDKESFQWEISAKNLTVDAVGTSVSGITLPPKKVTLKGCNGLRKGVAVDWFDLPADDPAGGIQVTIQSTVTNPSQLGIELSSVAFDVFARGIKIAHVSSLSEFVKIAPKSTFSLPLAGRLIPQNTSDCLAPVAAIFSKFIQGEDSEITVHGVSAGSGNVAWLSEGIQILEVETLLPNWRKWSTRGMQPHQAVTSIPGNPGQLNVIQSITLEQMELRFTEATAYNPATSSNATTIEFTLPFGFSLNVTSLSQDITVSSNGQSFARLAISETPRSTKGRIIPLTFSGVPLTVFSDRHSFFDKFVDEATQSAGRDVILSGVADAAISTAVGELLLSNIGFSVQSSIANLRITPTST